MSGGECYKLLNCVHDHEDFFVIKDVQPAGRFFGFSYVEEDSIVGDKGDWVVLYQFLN